MVIGKKKRRALIVTAAGMMNTGDNIVSYVAAGMFLRTGEYEIRFADLSFNPEEIIWADIIVIGGGGVFYAGPDENVENYLRFIDHARYQGKPSVVLGVGTQGIVTEYGRRRYKESLQAPELITVRDGHDAEVLSALGVNRPLHVTQDLAFMFSDVLPTLQSYFNKSTQSEAIETLHDIRQHNPKKQLIGISLSSERFSHVDATKKMTLKQKKLLDAKKIELIDDIYAEGHIPVLIQQSRDDEVLYGEIKEKHSDIPYIIIGSKEESLRALDVYRIFDFVITSRYHGLIMSLLAEKPTVVIDGVNGGKITRTIHSRISSLAHIIYNDKTMKDIDLKNPAKAYELSQETKDEINTSVVLARQSQVYLDSLLDFLNRK